MGPLGVPILFGGQSAWTPTQLGSSLVTWWDASQGVTESGGLVSAWADRVGGATVTQATGSLKPAYQATGMGGLPVLNFDGADDVMAVAPVPAGIPTGANSGGLFVLADQQALIADATSRYSAGHGAAAGTVAVRRQVATGVNRGVAVNSADGSVENTVDYSGIRALLCTFTDTTIRVRVDGRDGAAATVAAQTIQTTRLRIGSYINGSASEFWQGGIRHAIWISGAMSTADKEKLEAWALWEVGEQAKLPSGHTYETRRP